MTESKLSDSGIIRFQTFIANRMKYWIWAIGVILAASGAWFTLKFEVKANAYKIEQMEKRIDKVEDMWK